MTDFAGFADDEYRKLMDGFRRLGGDVKDVMALSVASAAIMVEKRVKERHYFIGTKRISKADLEAATYVFTNPDGTPRFKIRTAALLNSIHIKDKEETETFVAYSVAASQEYAKKVEEGAPGRKAFPFMRPAFEESRGEIVENAKRILKERIASWKP